MPENVHSARHWNVDPTHAPLGEGSGWWWCVSVGVGWAWSQLGEQDVEVDDSRVSYFSLAFPKSSF